MGMKFDRNSCVLLRPWQIGVAEVAMTSDDDIRNADTYFPSSFELNHTDYSSPAYFIFDSSSQVINVSSDEGTAPVGPYPTVQRSPCVFSAKPAALIPVWTENTSLSIYQQADVGLYQKS